MDDIAFAVRVKIVVPPQGLGDRLSELLHWLNDRVGPADHEVHPTESLGLMAAAFHFKKLDHA